MVLLPAKMLGILAKYIQDVSVLRRLLFAAVFLSPELPMFWGVVVEFATSGSVSKSSITPELAKTLIENIQAFSAAAFETDHALQKELIFKSTWKKTSWNSTDQSLFCLLVLWKPTTT